MNVFNVISLLGGLSMFLYGMKLMGDSLREGSSGTLKVVMEKVTNNIWKAFLLGVAVTTIIQSSTATIVITSGLVAAGIIKLKQSLGIIIGANVGTTATGQIIRLLDVDSSGASWLEIFKPSTLAPLALIVGVVLIIFLKLKKADNVGRVFIGFGILFTGLMNMTEAVSVLTEGGFIDNLFLNLGDNPILGYLTGAAVAFALQSSSSTIAILQAFAKAGEIPFKTVYIIIVGVYLGDCVTTAIVCGIGAKSDAKRVGIINILYNLGETIVVIITVAILHAFGVLDGLWERPLTPGGIANCNTIFNLACSFVFFPLIGFCEKLSRKLVKNTETTENVISIKKYSEKLDALNPVFFSTPALALRSCYDLLYTMLTAASANIKKAIGTLYRYDSAAITEINAEENSIDHMTDAVSNYMLQLSPHVKEDLHIKILDQYYKDVTEFEHLGDQAVNISAGAETLHAENLTFTKEAEAELAVVEELLDRILEYAQKAFLKRDIEAARHIEPLEEVMDDLINTLHDNHLVRLRDGKCSIKAGIVFLDVLSNLERISDTCSNIGVATITRSNPGMSKQAHSYISSLHQGNDEKYNNEYNDAHDKYFTMLENCGK